MQYSSLDKRAGRAGEGVILEKRRRWRALSSLLPCSTWIWCNACREQIGIQKSIRSLWRRRSATWATVIYGGTACIMGAWQIQIGITQCFCAAAYHITHGYSRRSLHCVWDSSLGMARLAIVLCTCQRIQRTLLSYLCFMVGHSLNSASDALIAWYCYSTVAYPCFG